MADLRLSHIYKVYDNGVKAVNDFNISISDKEFIVFVGPSGCGKSTTLRMIAGLESITSGDLYIGETRVNEAEPKDRDIAFVFQNYALYPHMTVYENMAFGLRNRHMDKNEIDKRVREAAHILDMDDYLDRKPKEMSGGQCQRVALGRAIVRNPKVFLLDEPLSNLDAKLRAQMRTEITKLHKKIQTTFIYVTHDQVEAMTMGTRIVVMKNGFIQQIDTPINLYERPSNKFVAGFIGTPQMNFFNCKLIKDKTKVKMVFDNSEVSINYQKIEKIDLDYLDGTKKVILGCRPDHIVVSKKEGGVPCKVSVIEQLGNESILYGVLEDGSQIVAKIPSGAYYESDETVYCSFIDEKLHFFDGETEKSILHIVPPENKILLEISNGSFNLFKKIVKLPPAFENVNLNGTYKLLISPFSFKLGNQLEVEIVSKEKVDDGFLYGVMNNKQKVFILLKEEFGIKEVIKVDILFDQLEIVDMNGETLIRKFSNEEIIPGTISMEKGPVEFKKMVNGKEITKIKKDTILFYVIGKTKIRMNDIKMRQLGAVEGRKCLKLCYNFVIRRSEILVGNKGIEVEIKEVLDYLNNKYGVVNVNGVDIKVLLTNENVGDKIKIFINPENISIYRKSDNLRIC